jgi:hypothetical protein
LAGVSASCTEAFSEMRAISHDFGRSSVFGNLPRHADLSVAPGVPESAAMKITDHKTRAVFERYNIVDQLDVEQAMERLAEFHHREDANLESDEPPDSKRSSRSALNRGPFAVV